jgi:type IV secretory pathway TrbF-like protein
VSLSHLRPISRSPKRSSGFKLAQFIGDARSVLGDGAAEKAALHRVYEMARGTAATTLATWYRDHPPFEIAAKETFQAQVDSVLREPSGAYEVHWRLRGKRLYVEYDSP